MNVTWLLAVLLHPYMPNISQIVMKQIQVQTIGGLQCDVKKICYLGTRALTGDSRTPYRSAITGSQAGRGRRTYVK